MSVLNHVTFVSGAPQEDISQLHDRFPKSVRRGHHSVISSKSIPAHGVDDVIPIVKEHENDPEADRFNSPDQSIGVSFFVDLI